MGLCDLLPPLVEQMIDWYRLREGSLKQMSLLARRRNNGLATMLAHTEASPSGQVTEVEVEMKMFDHLQLENSSGHECSSIGKLCSLR